MPDDTPTTAEPTPGAVLEAASGEPGSKKGSGNKRRGADRCLSTSCYVVDTATATPAKVALPGKKSKLPKVYAEVDGAIRAADPRSLPAGTPTVMSSVGAPTREQFEALIAGDTADGDGLRVVAYHKEADSPSAVRASRVLAATAPHLLAGRCATSAGRTALVEELASADPSTRMELWTALTTPGSPLRRELIAGSEVGAALAAAAFISTTSLGVAQDLLRSDAFGEKAAGLGRSDLLRRRAWVAGEDGNPVPADAYSLGSGPLIICEGVPHPEWFRSGNVPAGVDALFVLDDGDLVEKHPDVALALGILDPIEWDASGVHWDEEYDTAGVEAIAALESDASLSSLSELRPAENLLHTAEKIAKTMGEFGDVGGYDRLRILTWNKADSIAAAPPTRDDPAAVAMLRGKARSDAMGALAAARRAEAAAARKEGTAEGDAKSIDVKVVAGRDKALAEVEFVRTSANLAAAMRFSGVLEDVVATADLHEPRDLFTVCDAMGARPPTPSGAATVADVVAFAGHTRVEVSVGIGDERYWVAYASLSGEEREQFDDLDPSRFARISARVSRIGDHRSAANVVFATRRLVAAFRSAERDERLANRNARRKVAPQFLVSEPMKELHATLNSMVASFVPPRPEGERNAKGKQGQRRRNQGPRRTQGR